MSNCLTLTEIEALAAIDGIELERGEAAELQPVIAVLSTTGMSPSGMRRCCRPRVIAKSDTRAGCRRRKRTPTTRSSAARGRVLSGLKVRIKDNIAVAGVPTTNGSRLRSYTPDEDAVVVERSLAAGVTVAAKLNMDDWGGAGLGETSAFGPARSPLNPVHSAGGFSGSAGSAVRAGEVDLALAVDQGEWHSRRLLRCLCHEADAWTRAVEGNPAHRSHNRCDHACLPELLTKLRSFEVITGEDDRDPMGTGRDRDGTVP